MAEIPNMQKENMKKAQAQSFLNWQEIWQELNRVDREKLGL